MHDTAFRIGTLAMNIYADLSTANVLEVGSQAINGSLRANALPTTKYVGLDLEEGEGVDQVIQDGIMPVDDDSFDLVMASSVFEHDPAFWMTFLEMCRKTKDGGYIYINAPSNGKVHRYPQDNWRFYPDSGMALVKWAVSQGQHVSLVESFIAEREDDMWNDFVAVFRKGRITKKLPETFLHENVRCSNVMNWKSSEIINPRESSEDMVLLESALQRVKDSEQALARATESRDAAARDADELRAQQHLLVREVDTARIDLNDLARVRDDLANRESELRQRQEEIEQTRAELTRLRKEHESLAMRMTRDLETAEMRHANAEASAKSWKKLHDRQQTELANVREEFEQYARYQEKAQASELAKANAAAEQRLSAIGQKLASAEAARHEAQDIARTTKLQLGTRFQEIATLTTLLRQQEQESETALAQMDWLREATEASLTQPAWWRWLPTQWRRQKARARLRRLGLFDGDAYLERYPDVAAEGLDPFYHYVVHGLHERRSKDS